MNLSEYLDADACECMDSWVLGQIASWHTDPPTLDLAEEFERLNATTPSVFVLDIARGAVGIRQKPEAARNANYGLAFDRINGYRSWIADVVVDYHPDMCIALAVFVGDDALANPRAPVFAFQKPSANRSLLLPDVDLIKQGFAKPDDGLAYRDKVCHAIFAGSTTGGRLTAEAVRRDGGIPRIRAALHFRGSADVTFKLPNVTQHESVEVVELLRGMDVGVGARIDWPTQLRNRFIISMDGNGATCSRLAIVLGSNSALMKYDSDSQLYYFPGLRPWRHYIPITRHEDVTALVAAERARPGLFATIAANAQRFSGRFLQRVAARYYTAQLLGAYRNLVAVAPARNSTIARDLTYAARPALMLHVQNTGDLYVPAGKWGGQPGSRLAVEGFVLMPPDGMAPDDLGYQAVQVNGTLSPLVRASAYCGTRGRAEPLKGFRIQLANSARRAWQCECWVRYTNGVEAGPFGADVLFLAPEGAAIEAIRLSWQPRAANVAPIAKDNRQPDDCALRA